jgi:hypothetical protein
MAAYWESSNRYDSVKDRPLGSVMMVGWNSGPARPAQAASLPHSMSRFCHGQNLIGAQFL